MSRKAVLYSYKFFDAQVVAADATSPITNVANLDNCSIALVWSASTLVANVYVQVRNGENDAWRDVDFGVVPSISGASGNHEFQFTQLAFTHMRMFVDRSSGSGTVTATITAKTVGN